MTYAELYKLERSGKHKTIGSVQVFIHEEDKKKFNHIRVIYKSGRVFDYRRKQDLPKTVLDFCDKQNYHIVKKYKDCIVVSYFMREE